MPKFDRYLLAQLTIAFGFFALILIAIYWVNRAVKLFDQLIANGQTALVFLELTALSLPSVIKLVLPMAAFAASVYVANRMTAESELVVVQATGYSPFRLARPVLVFGLMVALIVGMLTNVLVPSATRTYATRQAEISQNITARFLTEGTFLHPAPGLTFYIREITREGELRDIFLSDATAADRRTSYSARRALLTRAGGGTKLIMLDGLAQTLEFDGQRLSVTAFSDFSYDIGTLIEIVPPKSRSLREIGTIEALWPTPEVVAETGASPGQLAFEGHSRLAQPTLSVVAALIGFAVLLVGAFSRHGLWKQIVGAVVAIILLKILDNAMVAPVQRNAALWPLAYLATLVGLGVTWALLTLAARPNLIRRRPARAVAA